MSVTAKSLSGNWWQATGWTEKQVELLAAERYKDVTGRESLQDGVNELIRTGKTSDPGAVPNRIIDAYTFGARINTRGPNHSHKRLT